MNRAGGAVATTAAVKTNGYRVPASA